MLVQPGLLGVARPTHGGSPSVAQRRREHRGPQPRTSSAQRRRQPATHAKRQRVTGVAQVAAGEMAAGNSAGLSSSIPPRSAAMSHRLSRRSETPDPRVLRPVRQVALAGLALVLVWPAARGHSEWIGWLPLWLVGMPMLAWWSLYRFAVPALPRRGERPARTRRRGRRRSAVAWVRARRRRCARPDLRQGKPPNGYVTVRRLAFLREPPCPNSPRSAWLPA